MREEKWDLQQLPGYEAIEEEKESESSEEPGEFSDAEESTVYKISSRDLNKLLGDDIYPDDDQPLYMSKKDIEKIHEENPTDKYIIRFYEKTKEAKVLNKTITLSYGESDVDKYLMNKESKDLLKSLVLKPPSYYKDKNLEVLLEALKKGQRISSQLKDALKNVAIFDLESDPGKAIAIPKNENPSAKTRSNIRKHNILEIYNYNLNQLRKVKKKSGTGIIHFNNPLQLLDRLGLLIGSILAGNNGVLQEFSQIAHLLHQMKVITKKQLNDLLKKYVLNK